MPKHIFSFSDHPPRVAYLDPSFLINFLIEDSIFHQACLGYSEILKNSPITLIMSNLGFEEIWFVLLKIYAMQYLTSQKEASPQMKWFRFLKENRDKIKDFASEIERVTLTIKSIPNLAIIEISEEQTMMALSYMKQYGLLPRDAIHAAATILSGAKTIITTDADFSAVAEIDVYTCNPKCFAS